MCIESMLWGPLLGIRATRSAQTVSATYGSHAIRGRGVKIWEKLRRVPMRRYNSLVIVISIEMQDSGISLWLVSEKSTNYLCLAPQDSACLCTDSIA